MWISNDTVIGNVNQDYTMEEWKDIFASIKVDVVGDFNAKYMLTEVDINCFNGKQNETGLTITDYNSSCGSQIIIPEEVGGKRITEIASNTFNNKGLIYVDIPNSVVKIGAYAFTENNIASINVPETVTNLHCKAFDDGVVKNRDMTYIATNEECFTVGTVKTYQLNSDMTDEELNKCTTYITNLNWGQGDGETAGAYCKGTGTHYDSTFQEWLINFDDEELTYLETNNIINLIDTYLSITDYNTSCGTDVVIPKVINGKTVKEIAYNSFNSKNLTSVVMSNEIKYISYGAFYNNRLRKIVFESPSTLETIGFSSFAKNNISAITIPDSVSILACDAFDRFVAITKSDSLVCTTPAS